MQMGKHKAANRFSKSCKCIVHTSNDSKVLDILKCRGVSATQLQILKEKTLLNKKSGFICEDCLAKYAKSYSCDKTNLEDM